MTISERNMGKLKTLHGEVDRARQKRDRFVRSLRENGATWTEIGYGLGITAQGAQKRYGSPSERHSAELERQAARGLKTREKKRS